ncbi:MAG: hypothetical protein L6V93_06840 [Clostridiales bacterium]|nr:MAG: hypothetical protein L6V93_06840 [Clostridiales bacterium]
MPTSKTQISRPKENQEVVLVLAQEATRCENKVTKAESDIESVINKLWDDYEITYSDAQSYKKELESFSEAQRERRRRLKSKSKSLVTSTLTRLRNTKPCRKGMNFCQIRKTTLTTRRKKSYRYY